jgi:hypothetical protein
MIFSAPLNRSPGVGAIWSARTGATVRAEISLWSADR